MRTSLLLPLIGRLLPNESLNSLMSNSPREFDRDTLRGILACVFLTLATFALYARSLTYGFSYVDGIGIVENNEKLDDGLSAKAIGWAVTTCHRKSAAIAATRAIVTVPNRRIRPFMRMLTDRPPLQPGSGCGPVRSGL